MYVYIISRPRKARSVNRKKKQVPADEERSSTPRGIIFVTSSALPSPPASRRFSLVRSSRRR